MLLLTNAVFLLYEAGLVYVITTDSFQYHQRYEYNL